MQRKLRVSLVVIMLLIAIIPLQKHRQALAQSSFEERLKKDPAKIMADFDYKHTRKEFESLLNILCNLFPGKEKWEIELKIWALWDKTKETLPDLSLYDFTVSFKNYARDNILSGLSFEEILAMYATSKQFGY